MKNLTFWLILTFPLWFASCTNDSEMESGGFKLPLRSINKFEITSSYNGDKLDISYLANIDEVNKIIKLSLPATILQKFPTDTSCTFIPLLSISRGAKVEPKNLQPINLKFNPQSSDSLLYTVVAEDGRKAVYTLKWDFNFKYKKAIIQCYEFPDIIDPLTGSPKRTNNAATWMLYPKSWFTFFTPAKRDSYNDEIGYIRMRIILTPESKNATITQPVASEAVVSGLKYLQNPTRLSLTEPFVCNRNYKQPLYTFTITSEDGKSSQSYYFTLHWDTTL